MQREQFTFYRSFWNAMRALPKEERADFVEALCAYAMDERETDLSETVTAAAVFCVVRPILDKARLKAEGGRSGGKKAEASASKTEASASKPKQKKSCLPKVDKQVTGTDTEPDTGTDTEPDTETDTGPDDDDPPTPLAGDCPDPPAREGPSPESVIVVVRQAVGELSQKARRELDGFLRDMGPDCVLRALEAAQDAGKANWTYVRGILRRKQAQGVTSAADWDRSEDAHARQVEELRANTEARKRPAIAGTPVDVQPSEERGQRSAARLRAFLAEQERDKTRAEEAVQ